MKYFTVLTIVDDFGGKSFFSARGKSEKSSVEKVFSQWNQSRNREAGDTVHSVRTWDDIESVRLSKTRA